MKQKHFNSTPAKLMDEIMQARRMYKEKNGEFPTLVFMNGALLPALYHYIQKNPDSTLIKHNPGNNEIMIKEMKVFFLPNLTQDKCFMAVPQFIELDEKLFIEEDLDQDGKKKGNAQGKKSGKLITPEFGGGKKRSDKTDGKAEKPGDAK